MKIITLLLATFLLSSQLQDWQKKANRKIKKYSTAVVIRGLEQDESSFNILSIISKKPSQEELKEFQYITDNVHILEKNELNYIIDTFLQKYQKSVFKSDLKELKKILK
ncbi:MAG: hypothetical protein NZ870_00300 [bacterium]|nr:hypothetical protein [bacterium]